MIYIDVSPWYVRRLRRVAERILTWCERHERLELYPEIKPKAKPQIDTPDIQAHYDADIVGRLRGKP